MNPKQKQQIKNQDIEAGIRGDLMEEGKEKDKTIWFFSRETYNSDKDIGISFKEIITKILPELKKEAREQTERMNKKLNLGIHPERAKEMLLNLWELEEKYGS